MHDVLPWGWRRGERDDDPDAKMSDGKPAKDGRQAATNGRPSKRDPLILAAIVARVRQGERVHTAAEAEGVANRTVAYWLNSDDADPVLGSFRQDVAQARAQYLSDRLAVVRTAEMPIGREPDGSPILAPDPKWAAWELERADPDNYAPTIAIMVRARDEATDALLAALQSAPYPLASFADVIAVLRGEDEAEHVEH